MKTPILFFAAGAAAGALAMWLLSSSATATAGNDPAAGKSAAGRLGLAGENQKLTARVQALEKQLKDARGGERSGDAGVGADQPEEKRPQVVTTHFDDTHMEEMMRERAGRDVNREVDRLALRLKLTAEQKESLRKFLMEGKERERASFKEAMKKGGKVELAKSGQSRDEFLKGLLTAEQQEDYARSREEQRIAKAEEFAQRKVRKLNNDLNLSEEQKDKLFQAYAQRKLAATDPSKQTEISDVPANATGRTIAFASVSGAVDGGGAVEFDLDVGDLAAPGSNDIDRGSLESILTPEQLAVYDQRRAEEQAQTKNMIRLDGLPVPAPGGGDASGAVIRIEKSVEQFPGSPPAAGEPPR